MEINFDSELFQTLQTLSRTALFSFIVLFIVYNWEKIEKFSTSIAKILTGIFRSSQSEVVRLTLQSTLNQAITELDKEAPGLFEKSIRVKWLESGSEHINANKKGVFIRVNKNEDSDHLFRKAVSFLFDNALLVNSREYIHGHIFQAIKLVLTEKMLSSAGLQSATISFRKDEYNPVILRDKSIAQATNQMEFLEYRGLFTRVFLRECIDLYLKVGIGHEGSKPKWDLSRFLEFTNNLFQALDKEGVRASFEYPSSTLNIAFAVLADEYTWARMGSDFYKKRTKVSIQRGATTIYVIALGTRNVTLANSLVAWLQSQGFIEKKYLSYYNLAFGRNSNVAAVCIRCVIQPSARSKVIDAEADTAPEIIQNDFDLHETIRSVIQDQDIEIIKSAWLKGYQAQVVVHSKSPRKNVLQVCIGKNGANGKELQKIVGDYVRFIEWSPDIRDAIIRNLDNHESSEILKTIIEPGSRAAYIYVQFPSTVSKLVGKDSKTLKLAEALTEYYIEIQVDPKSDIVNKLCDLIPEVEKGEIRILDLAMLVDQEIRILVSSDVYDYPAAICGGYINELKSSLNIKERIYFANKKHNIEEAVVAALFPLRNEDVIKVIQDNPTKFTVVVGNRDTMAKGIGTDGAHVRTASQLLGVWIQLALPEDVEQ